MSPKTVARAAAACSLLTLIGGVVAQALIANRLISARDAVTTAGNIVAHRQLYLSGFTVFLAEMAANIATTVLFYVLLRPVARTAALVALVFGLVGCTIKTLARAFYYAPLLILGGADYLSVFSTSQLQALALLSIRLNNMMAGIALVFLGVSTLFLGYLIIKSTFLPRFLGVIAVVSGFGWLSYAYPPLGSALFYYMIVVAMLNLVLTAGWLLVRGVDEQRWREQSATSGA